MAQYYIESKMWFWVRYTKRLNPFSTSVPLKDKPGSWFLHKWDIGRKWVNDKFIGRNLVSWKDSLVLFSFSLVLGSSAEILSGLKLHLHLTILVLFLSGPITSSFLTGQVSLPCSIMLPAHAQKNLPFAPDSKTVLANKGTKTINLLHSFLILVSILSTAGLVTPICDQITKRFHNFTRLAIWFYDWIIPCYVCLLVCAVWHLNLLSVYH